MENHKTDLSSTMGNEKTPSTYVSIAKEKSLPMDKKDTKPETSVTQVKEEINLLPCTVCREVPGTIIDFTAPFRELSKFECMKFDKQNRTRPTLLSSVNVDLMALV
jgi:hypothetical protein